MKPEELHPQSEHSASAVITGNREGEATDSQTINVECSYHNSEVHVTSDGSLPQSVMALTLKQYAELVSSTSCRWCKASLKGGVEYYDHSGGWEVAGFSEKQWLYTTCPRCKYQWNLGKLGIAR